MPQKIFMRWLADVRETGQTLQDIIDDGYDIENFQVISGIRVNELYLVVIARPVVKPRQRFEPDPGVFAESYWSEK